MIMLDFTFFLGSVVRATKLVTIVEQDSTIVVFHNEATKVKSQRPKFLLLLRRLGYLYI